MWKATLYNSLGCILAKATAKTTRDLSKDISLWTLANGDYIKIEGPEE